MDVELNVAVRGEGTCKVCGAMKEVFMLEWALDWGSTNTDLVCGECLGDYVSELVEEAEVDRYPEEIPHGLLKRYWRNDWKLSWEQLEGMIDETLT